MERGGERIKNRVHPRTDIYPPRNLLSINMYLSEIHADVLGIWFRPFPPTCTRLRRENDCARYVATVLIPPALTLLWNTRDKKWCKKEKRANARKLQNVEDDWLFSLWLSALTESVAAVRSVSLFEPLLTLLRANIRKVRVTDYNEIGARDKRAIFAKRSPWNFPPDPEDTSAAVLRNHKVEEESLPSLPG